MMCRHRPRPFLARLHPRFRHRLALLDFRCLQVHLRLFRTNNDRKSWIIVSDRVWQQDVQTLGTPCRVSLQGVNNNTQTT